jgi:hypothetical protein
MRRYRLGFVAMLERWSQPITADAVLAICLGFASPNKMEPSNALSVRLRYIQIVRLLPAKRPYSAARLAPWPPMARIRIRTETQRVGL